MKNKIRMKCGGGGEGPFAYCLSRNMIEVKHTQDAQRSRISAADSSNVQLTIASMYTVADLVDSRVLSALYL